jgi:acyl carrier protein
MNEYIHSPEVEMPQSTSLPEFMRSFEDLMEAPPQSIQDNTEFRNLPKWDSLKMVELLAMLDEDFGVNVEVSQLQTCRTVSDVFVLVRQ